MPSTEYFGATLVNLGPLTTTFTPAPSCTADPLNFYVQDPDLTFIRYRPSCDAPQPQEGCAPSASKQAELITSYFKGEFRPKFVNYVEYYSPASICPKGWTTAGTAASASSDAKVKATGVLDVGDWPPREAPDLPALALDFARQANRWLKPGETIIWCCPQDYEADVEGSCRSTLGAYGPKANGQALSTFYVCEVPSTYTNTPSVITVSTFDGTTWDPPILSWTDYDPVLGTPASALTAEETTYTVVVATPAMMLVSGGDGNSDDGDDDDDDDSDDTGSSGGEDKKDSNDEEEESSGEETGGNNEEDGAMALDPKGVVSIRAMAVAVMVGAGVFGFW